MSFVYALLYQKGYPIRMNVDRSYVARTLALANLAPDIVKLIWEGRQPKGLTLEKLRQGITDSWAEQRRVFGVV